MGSDHMSNMDHSREEIDFQDKNYANGILKKLLVQVDNEKFCDLVLNVKGKLFYAHRNIFAACSPYFESVLKTHRFAREQLTISCHDSEIFKCLLHYIYTGSVVIDKENVYELLRLANSFLLAHLKNLCSEYLTRFMDVENCLEIREASEKYNLPVLCRAVTNFILSNMDDILRQSSVLSLPLSKIERFLSNKAWKIPEVALLSFLSCWVRRDIKNREGDFRTLLTFVDWSKLSSEYISFYLEGDELFTASEKCLYFALHSILDSGEQLPNYHEKYMSLFKIYNQESLAMDSNSFLGFAISAAIEGLGDSPGAFLKQLDPDCIPEDLSLALPTDWKSKESCIDFSTFGIKSAFDDLSHSSMEEDSSLQNSNNDSCNSKPSVISGVCKLDTTPRDGLIDARILDADENSVVITEGVKCPHCNYFSSSMLSLERHLSVAHQKDVLYKCSICDFTCKWNREYYEHMREHFAGPPYNCDTCGYSCEKIHLLLIHKAKHINSHPFKCSECDYRSKTKANLSTHLRSHTGEKPFQCSECDKGFSTKATLDQHLASHSSSRPFVCDECGFSTKYNSHLLAHKRIHTGEVYYCQYSGCSYSSPKKSQLTAHMRTHMPERKHVCEICRKGFVEKSHLSRHEKIHSDLKPFQCPTCSYSSTRSDKLKEHMKRHIRNNTCNFTDISDNVNAPINEIPIINENHMK